MSSAIVLRHAVVWFVVLFAWNGFVRAAEDAGGAEPDATLGWREKILRSLDKPVTLEVCDEPLYEVVTRLGKQAGIPNFFIDVRSLEEVGIGADTPITWELRELPLRSTLNLILRELDLKYTIRDGALLITTPEEDETRLITEVFDVLDLVRPHELSGSEQFDYDSLIELITYVVEPTTWSDAGGASEMEAFRGTLVITQTQPVLDEIRDLLDTLRVARKVYVEHGSKTPPTAYFPVGYKPYKEINAALSTAQDFDFQSTPLKTIVAELVATYKIPIQIDSRAVQDVGLSEDVPVTFAATNLSVRHALRHILGQLDLTFSLIDRVLLITTPEEAVSFPITRVYPVADLVLVEQSPSNASLIPIGWSDFDSIIEVITSIVAPTEWVDAGGSGSIEGEGHSMSLVVSQTREIHEEIELLLAKIRKTKAEQQAGQAASDADGEDGLRLVIYFVLTKSSIPEQGMPSRHGDADSEVGQLPPKQVLAQFGGGAGGFFLGMHGTSALFNEDELLEVIQELVEPDSWREDGVFARAAPGRLIIKQTPEVHRKIGPMLTRLGVFYHDSANRKLRGFVGGIGGFGGGMGMGGGGGMGGMGGMGGGGGFF